MCAAIAQTLKRMEFSVRIAMPLVLLASGCGAEDRHAYRELDNQSTTEAGQILNAAAEIASLDRASSDSARVPDNYTRVPVGSCGGTDDTAMLQGALNALRPNQVLELPAGICATTKQLVLPGKNRVAVVGAGKERTVIVSHNAYDGGIRVLGGNTVWLSDFQVRYETQQKRGNKPESTCFAVTPDERKRAKPPRNVRLERLIANGCTGGGFFLLHATDAVVANNEVRYSKADGIHITGGSHRVTVQSNLVVHAGDDALAAIGNKRPQSQVTDVKFLDNVVIGGPWGGGGHADNAAGIVFARNRISRVGVSCIAVSSDGVWSGSNPSNHIVVENNVLEGCVTRKRTGHPSIAIYSSNGGTGQLGPDIVIRGNVVRSPASGPAFRSWGWAAIEATLTGNVFCGMRTPVEVLTGTIHQSQNTYSARC
jgi:Right handed beta helix region